MQAGSARDGALTRDARDMPPTRLPPATREPCSLPTSSCLLNETLPDALLYIGADIDLRVVQLMQPWETRAILMEPLESTEKDVDQHMFETLIHYRQMPRAIRGPPIARRATRSASAKSAAHRVARWTSRGCCATGSSRPKESSMSRCCVISRPTSFTGIALSRREPCTAACKRARTLPLSSAAILSKRRCDTSSRSARRVHAHGAALPDIFAVPSRRSPRRSCGQHWRVY